jgi:ATP-dependent Lon protease
MQRTKLMRDFRDAKSMAQTLRESLTAKAVTISHSESLELASKMLGVADWNTLSALLQTERRGGELPVRPRQATNSSYPVIPIRDFVPFPTATFPLFVGRVKTMQALDQAFERQCEVVLAVQRDPAIDEPGLDDVYEIGVLSQLLELEQLGDGTLKVLVQTHRRVAIRRFVGESGAFEAEITDVSEGRVADAPDLTQQAIKHFEAYTAARGIRIPQIWPLLDQTRDPGRIADIIASRMRLPLSEKQNVLATVDPVARLARVDALMKLPVPPPSLALEATRRRALGYANQRRHQYATLEHLLLALIDDTDAAAVLQTCKADLGALQASLLNYLDHELKGLVIESGADARPTAAYGRVTERATLDAQASGRSAVTGANTLLAIFPETRSPAVRFLGEQGVWPGRVSDLIGKAP